MALSIGHGFNVGDGPDFDFSPSGTVCLLDSLSSENLCPCRKIRPFDNSDHLVDGRFPAFLHLIIDDFHNRLDDLTEIVGRNVGGHSDSDSRSSVDQKVWKSCRQYRRFLFRFIEVWNEVHRVLIDIRQHLHGNFT